MRNWSAVFLALSFAAAGCGGHRPSAPAPPATVGASDVAPDPTGAGKAYAELVFATPLDDAQAAAALLAANDAIVSEANVGATRGQNGDVQAFGEESVTGALESTQAGSDVIAKAGIALDDSPASTAIRNADVETLAALDAAPTSSFDLAFVDARTDACGALLELVDRAILPGVRDAGLAAWVRDFRTRLVDEQMQLATLRAELTKGG
jgi:predicted outer membrane protein